MKWLLIIIIYGYPVIAGDFDSKAACMNAGKIFQQNVEYDPRYMHRPQYLCGPISRPQNNKETKERFIPCMGGKCEYLLEQLPAIDPMTGGQLGIPIPIENIDKIRTTK